MKVLLINGSPNEFGCTYTALAEAQRVFEGAGIETEIVYLGKKPVAGCIACGLCRKTGLLFAHQVFPQCPRFASLIYYHYIS